MYSEAPAPSYASTQPKSQPGTAVLESPSLTWLATLSKVETNTEFSIFMIYVQEIDIIRIILKDWGSHHNGLPDSANTEKLTKLDSLLPPLLRPKIEQQKNKGNNA